MVDTAANGDKEELLVKALFKVMANDARDDENYGLIWCVAWKFFFSSLSKNFPRKLPLSILCVR